jgi:endonuclease/exonuclease/phosphatase family metal-dependent hydrolase
MKVMSFNIRFGTADDGPNSWEFRRDAVMEMLGASGAVVIGMQEVLASQLDEIRQVLPRYDFVGVGREDGVADGEFCAILFDKQQIQVEASDTYWFSDTPEVVGSSSWGNSNTRVCTHGVFAFEGRHFNFFNLHIDHESAISRFKSIQLLTSRITDVDELPCIITGDFNDDEDSIPIKMMAEAGFEDTFRTINPDVPEQATYHGWTDMLDGSKIDYIFVSHGLRVKDASINREKPFGTFVSDHYPVTATLAFSPTDV